MQYEIKRRLRLSVNAINPKTGGLIVGKHYDFEEDQIDMSLEDTDCIDRVEEWVRREAQCRTRTVKQWVDAIEQLVPDYLRAWVGSIIWYDYVAEKKAKDTEFYEAKYVEGFAPPLDDENYDGDLAASLEALEYPCPRKRVYGPQTWDEFYDEVQKKLRVRMDLNGDQRKKAKKLS